jgi:hypothetical protein
VVSGPPHASDKPHDRREQVRYVFGGVGICVKVHGTVSGSVEVHAPCHTSPVEVSSVT